MLDFLIACPVGLPILWCGVLLCFGLVCFTYEVFVPWIDCVVVVFGFVDCVFLLRWCILLRLDAFVGGLLVCYLV